MRVITLTTDFGLRDGYAGVLKGVIWKIAPEVKIADISHLISPQNVMEGALTLGRAAAYFPEGTIHVGVVDPGVGTSRRAIAARLGLQYFVGPDNGLFTVLLEQAEGKQEKIEVFHLNRPEFWLSSISNVFHGRDIFAPTAAHLGQGVRLESMGTYAGPATAETARTRTACGRMGRTGLYGSTTLATSQRTWEKTCWLELLK